MRAGAIRTIPMNISLLSSTTFTVIAPPCSITTITCTAPMANRISGAEVNTEKLCPEVV